MEQFRRWFFPSTGNNASFYCRYDDKTLQAYSAIMHFTGALASIPASYFTQHWGRKGYVHSNQCPAIDSGLHFSNDLLASVCGCRHAGL